SGKVPTGLDGLFADALAQKNIRIEEIFEKFGEERVAICGDSFLDALEHAAVHAIGVVGCFQQVRWDASDNYGLAHTLRSILADVACYFTTAHREADQCEIAQIELGHDLV